MSLTQEILTLNTKRSEEFCKPQSRDRLALYSSQHPTKILVFKCMDGRINLPLITGVPLGKLHPFRHIGGKFILGDPYLGRLVLDAKDEAVRGGRAILALCTYHFSKGSERRGCAGHKHDTRAARDGAFALKREFEEVFGVHNPAMSAVVIGIETDEDALIFVGDTGEDFAIRDHLDMSDAILKEELTRLYPTLTPQIIHDILPLATGNRDHVMRIVAEGRPVADLVHNENIICVGRGFDWLHLPNRALIIGPYGHIDSTWRDAIVVAGDIVRGNFEQNESLRHGGALLLISAPYASMGERGLASAKAKYFAKIAKMELEPVAEKLKLEVLIGITDMATMRYHPL